MIQVIIFLFTIFLYLLSVCPTVYWGDSGEFISVAYTLGVAHTTSYPLYTLFGKLFTFLPIENVAARCNFFSLFFASLSVVIVYNILLKFLPSFFSVLGSLIFSVLTSFWHQATISEVHTLSIFFLSVLILILLTDNPRRNILFFFTLGLALCNHNLILISLPAFLYFLFRKKFFSLSLSSILLLLLSLCIYLYVPLRSASSPNFDFGNPETLRNFISLITGAGARQLLLPSFPLFLKQLNNYYKDLVYNFHIILLFLPFGLIHFFKKNKRVFIFFLLIYFLTLIFALNLKIPDISPYFLPSNVILCFFIITGIYYLSIIILKNNRITYFILLLLVFLLLRNHKEVNKNKNFFPYYYGKNCLEGIPSNSIILTADNNFAFILWYLQNVEGMKKNVKVIYTKLLSFSWYREKLNLEKINTEDKFDDALSKRLQEKIIFKNFKKNFIYLTDFEEGLTKYFLIPQRNLILVGREKIKATEFLPNLKGLRKSDKQTKDIYTSIFLNLSRCYLNRGEIKMAIREINKGINISPNYAPLYNNLGFMYYLKGDEETAVFNYKKAIALDEELFGVHTNLGVVYQRLGKTSLAKREFEVALKKNPEDTSAKFNLASIYYEQGIKNFRAGNLNRAIFYFEKSLKLEPKIHSSLYGLVISYVKKGEKDKAIYYFNKYIKTSPPKFYLKKLKEFMKKM